MRFALFHGSTTPNTADTKVPSAALPDAKFIVPIIEGLFKHPIGIPHSRALVAVSCNSTTIKISFREKVAPRTRVPFVEQAAQAILSAMEFAAQVPTRSRSEVIERCCPRGTAAAETSQSPHSGAKRGRVALNNMFARAESASFSE
jgi:hypothetical protein